jgi:hypothetical protein
MKYSKLYNFDSNQYDAVEISKIDEKIYLLKLFVKEISGIIIKKKNKFKRTKNVSLNEYDNNWKEERQSISLKNFNSLEDFAFLKILNGINTKEIFGNYLMNGKIYKTSPYDYNRFCIIPLYNFLLKHTITQDVICELGCGSGRNLFRLKVLQLKNKLEGFEPSKNANEFSNEINHHFSTNIEFSSLDLTEKIDKNALAGKTVFTHYVMEQLKHSMSTVIENILESKPKQVIHFEPTVDLFKNSFRDITAKAYFQATDYQNNLLTVLKKFENEKKLKIHDYFRLGYGKPNYEQCLIHWSPIN